MTLKILGVLTIMLAGVYGYRYHTDTYKGMPVTENLFIYLPEAAKPWMKSERFNELHVRKFSNGEELFTLLTDCKDDGCHVSQSAVQSGSHYTGSGYVIVQTTDRELHIYSEVRIKILQRLHNRCQKMYGTSSKNYTFELKLRIGIQSEFLMRGDH